MEPAMLLERRPLTRTYKHYSISSKPEPERKKSEFFYIGKKTSNISQLIQAFESGYAAESIDNAKSMLARLSRNRNFPDFILIEAGMGISAIRLFAEFLRDEMKQPRIPLLLDGSFIDADTIKNFRTYTFFDEIITQNEFSKEILLKKINFWKKIKQLEPRVADQDKEKISANFFPAVKRVLDIVLSLALLVLLSPLFLLIMIALRVESKGPSIYTSRRAGKGYRIFTFYKFRTMVHDADKRIDHVSHLNQYDLKAYPNPRFLKINNDPRVTKIGLFLRKTSMDELPQLFNVLKGDMSLVGNRPLPLYEAETLTTDLWAKRFLAPAGITGLWQIKKRGKEEMSAAERVSLDIRYAEKSNLLYDFWIMANTPTALIQKTNV